MSYEVVWDVQAYRKLEKIWDETQDIGPAVNAFDEIERRLSQQPENEGESRSRGRRIILLAPLGAIYRVQPRLQEVHILDVWAFRERKR